MDRELLENLCKRYGFNYDTIGHYVRIKSKRKDEWYLLDLELDGHDIKLYHGNEKNNAKMHKQGKHKDLNCIFRSIKSHDEREQLGHRNNKLTRLTDIFNQLNIIQ